MDSEVKLVLDTLYERGQRDKKGCFTVNRAGLDLLKSHVGIVPVIEQVLQEVDRALPEWETGTFKLPGLDPLWDAALSQNAPANRFPGLDYVLGAYLVLGIKSNPERVVNFLTTVSSDLLVKAIRNIPVFFSSEGEGYNSGLSPEGKLMDFVRGLRTAESQELRVAAADVLERMTTDEQV